MKIKLLENVDVSNVFKLHTGASYYDEFFEPSSNSSGPQYMQQAKNRIGKVEMMTPNEYYEKCAKDIFNMSVDSLMRSRRSDGTTQQYVDAMLNGSQFPLCYLDYTTHNQEGLHRMMAAGEAFGWNTKFPVLCVYFADQKKEDLRKLKMEIYDFTRYYLPKCTRYAEDYINENMWDVDEVPDNFIEIWGNLVKEYANKEYQVNIEVDIELKEFDGDDTYETTHRVDTYMTDYNGYECDYIERCDDNIWLEDLFYQALTPDTDIDIDWSDIDDTI